MVSRLGVVDKGYSPAECGESKHSPLDMIRHDRTGSVQIALELSDTPGTDKFVAAEAISRALHPNTACCR
jgi:hypothetical protein